MTQWQRLLHAAKAKADLLFGKHLLATNCTICCASSLCGDLISQRIERHDAHSDKLQQQQQQLRQQLSVRAEAVSVNWRRSGMIGCCALALGPMSHYWYLFLDRRFAGRSARALLTKTALDTVLFSPIYISLYCLIVGTLSGVTLRAAVSDLRTTGWQIYQYEASVWSVAQLCNFYFLPTKFRVMFDNALSLVFDVLYSHFYFTNRALDSQLPLDNH